jgi:chromosome segregation ATPase
VEFAKSEVYKAQTSLFEERFRQVTKEYEQKRAALEREYELLSLPFESEPNVLLALAQQRRLQLEDRARKADEEIQKNLLQIDIVRAELKTIVENEPTKVVFNDKALSENPLAKELKEIGDGIAKLRVDRLRSGHTRSKLEGINQDLERLEARRIEIESELDRMRKKKEVQSQEALRVRRELVRLESTLPHLRDAQGELEESLGKQRDEERVLEATIARLGLLRSKFEEARRKFDAYQLQAESRSFYSEARKHVQHVVEVTDDVQVSERARALHIMGRRKLVLAVGLISFAVGCAIAFLLGMTLDSSLHSAEDVERMLGVPVLACVPEIGRGYRRWLRALARLPRRISLPGGESVVPRIEGSEVPRG